MNYGKTSPSWPHQKAQVRLGHYPRAPQPGIQPNQLNKKPQVKRGLGFWENMINDYWKSLGV